MTTFTDITSDDSGEELTSPLSPLTAETRKPFLAPGKTYAEDPEMRAQFRKATYGVGGLEKPERATSRKKTFMTEDEALEMDNEGVDPAKYILDTLKDPSVTSLDMGHMKLARLPEELLRFGDQLQTLVARKNHLVELNPNFGVLSNLRTLNLQRNRLTTLPASISMLEHLTSLDVSNNQLRSLPEEMEDLTELQSVIVDFNYLESFPTVFLGLPKLSMLYLIENSGVSALPPPDKFRNIRTDLTVSMDNTPEIQSQWDAIRSAVPNLPVKMLWNKIWPDKVVDGLYIGSLRTAQNASVFSNLGITSVVTCGRNLHTNIPTGVQQLTLEVDDNDEEQLNAHFHKAIKYMNQHILATPPGACLVHCFAGVSRSATIVIAYLMHQRKISFPQAIALVREQRPAVNPNENFCRQLQQFEAECLAPNGSSTS